VANKWVRFQNFTNGYLVNDVYQIITRVEQPNFDIRSHIIWCKVVSLKVSLFAWRFFNNRISTKDDIFRQDLVPTCSLLCL